MFDPARVTVVHESDRDRAWQEGVSGLRCLMCGRTFRRPQPRLHIGQGVRRWAVGFSEASSRKGLSRALKANHRKRCPVYGPMLAVGR